MAIVLATVCRWVVLNPTRMARPPESGVALDAAAAPASRSDVSSEGFGEAFVRGMKNNQSAVGGLGKRAGKNDFTALASFGGQAQVFAAERRATGDKVIDDFVKQGVVVHRVHPFQ